MPTPRKTSRIPEARRLIEVIAFELDRDPGTKALALELRRIARELMWRFHSPVPIAPPRNHTMTPSLAAKARALKGKYPNLSQAEIGRQLDINAGRVSEALAGFDRSPSPSPQPKRKPRVP